MAGHGDHRDTPGWPAQEDMLGELLGELDQLRVDATRLLQPPAAVGAAAAPLEVTDATGSVRVAVDRQGHAAEVEIGRSWRSRLGPEGLATALFETYHAARAQALAAGGPAAGTPAAGEAANGAAANGAAANSSAANSAAAPERYAGEAGAQRWEQLAALRGRLDRVRITQERLGALGGLPLVGTREHTGRHGYLTARVRGTAIVAITSDARIWSAENGQLQQDALDVLTPSASPGTDPSAGGPPA